MNRVEEGLTAEMIGGVPVTQLRRRDAEMQKHSVTALEDVCSSHSFLVAAGQWSCVDPLVSNLPPLS